MTGLQLKNKILSPQIKMIFVEVILFALGFFLMPLQFYFGICPFAISLISASRKYTPFAFAGAILSVIFFMGADVTYVVALIALIGLRIVASFIKVENDKYKLSLDSDKEDKELSKIFCESVYLRVSVGALVSLGIGIYFVIANGYLYYDIFAMVFSSVFTGALTYMLSGAFEKERKSSRFSIAILAFIFILAYAFRGVELFGIDISMFMSFTLVLYMSRYVSGIKACVFGLALGVAQSVMFAPVYGIAGLVSGFIWRLSPFLAIMSGFVLSLGYGIYSAGYQAIVYLAPELLASSLIMYPLIRFELLPKLKIIKRESKVSKSIEAVIAEGKSRDAKRRLNIASKSFEGVSKMLKDISRRMKSPDRAYYGRLSLETTEAYCYTCPKKDICWQNDTRTTERNISRLGEGAFLNGESRKSDVEERFLHRCPHIEGIIDDINKKSKSELKEGIKNDKLELSAKCYELVSKLFSKIGSGIEKNKEIDVSLSNKVSSILSNAGLVFGRSEAYGRGKIQIAVTDIDLVRSSCKGEDISNALTKELKIPFGKPSLQGSMDSASLEIESLARNTVKCYPFGLPASEREVSGDSVSIFQGEDEEQYVIICDGMGSGKEAKLTSKMCVEFLEKTLSVTKEKELLLSMLNSLVRAKSQECSSSVDLLEIDSFSGSATLIKSGSAPSYVKRGDKILKLQSKTAPIGILKELDAQRHEFAFEKGDLIVMVSDGILPVRSNDSWLNELIENETDIKALPKKIVEGAKRENKDKLDDMTVVCALIE
ncbi:MAG: SpoIIE family protein phosphatase [Clostridia bacterium]|nr:SpoIIE family protein phosphatase [Clostridia bacterium]